MDVACRMAEAFGRPGVQYPGLPISVNAAVAGVVAVAIVVVVVPWLLLSQQAGACHSCQKNSRATIQSRPQPHRLPHFNTVTNKLQGHCASIIALFQQKKGVFSLSMLNSSSPMPVLLFPNDITHAHETIMTSIFGLAVWRSWL